MKRWLGVTLLLLTTAELAAAGPAAGTFTSPTGTISPKQAIGYIVRDPRNPRSTRVELMLTDVPVNAAGLSDDLDPHVRAINLPEIDDRNYVLLWVDANGRVSMNATYSKTMTQYLNDSAGGLKAEFTTNTPSQIEGRVYGATPFKTMDGSTYTVDLKFSADIPAQPTGTPLPAGGGEPGKALTAFLDAVTKKDWPGIKAGLSATTLPMFDKSYNSPAENAESTLNILNARLPMSKLRVAGGKLLSDTVAVLEVEGERFGSQAMSLVRMVKTGAAWQFDQSAPVR